MRRIVSIITYYLVKEQYIPKKDYLIYRYGLTVFFLSFINLITAFILALLFGKISVLGLFLFCIVPFRTLIGGFHNVTPVKCFVSTQILALFSQVVGAYGSLISFRALYIISFACVLLFILLSYRHISFCLQNRPDYSPSYATYSILHFFIVMALLILTFYFAKPNFICIINYALLLQALLSIDTRS